MGKNVSDKELREISKQHEAQRGESISSREFARGQHAARDDCQTSNHPTDRRLAGEMRNKRTPDHKR